MTKIDTINNLGKISVVGLGEIGSAISENLIECGLNIQGYNRSHVSGSIRDRIPIIGNIQEGVRSVEYIIIALSDENAIRSLFLNNDDLSINIRKETYVIDVSTHNPIFARFLFKIFSSYGVRYIDAPVSGGSSKARKGELTIMAGGDKNDFNHVRTLLNIIGDEIYFMGNSGNGQAAKLVNQVLVGASQVIISEALLFGKAAGLDLNQLFEVITSSAGNSYMFQRSAPQMMNNEYSSEFQSYLISKDLQNVMEYADNNSLRLLVSGLAAKILKRHAGTTYKNLDGASVFESYREIAQELNHDVES